MNFVFIVILHELYNVALPKTTKHIVYMRWVSLSLVLLIYAWVQLRVVWTRAKIKLQLELVENLLSKAHNKNKTQNNFPKLLHFVCCLSFRIEFWMSWATAQNENRTARLLIFSHTLARAHARIHSTRDRVTLCITVYYDRRHGKWWKEKQK